MKKVETEPGVRPLNVPDPRNEARWGKATVLHKGDVLGETRLRDARVFYPAFPDLSGNRISPDAIAAVIQRLLQEAGCHTDRAHVTRHTAASVALNEWGCSVKDVCQIFHWTTEALVWSRYARQQDAAVFLKFDALTESAYALQSDTKRVVCEVALALASLLQQIATSQADPLVPVWHAISRAHDTIAALDPAMPRLVDATVLTPTERATLDAFIRQRTDRHTDLEGLLERRITPGLPIPQPTREGQEDSEQAA